MRAILYFIVAAIFWGLNFHFAKTMLNEVRFMEAGFWRYLFGIIPLFLLAYQQLPSWKTIQEHLKGILLVGVLCLFGFNILFFLGLKFSPAINGALIISITPMLTLLFSNRILKTPLKANQLIGVTISLLGVLYLILKGNLGNFTAIEFSVGDILLFFASVLFALQNVWIKIYGGGISNRNFTFLTNLLCWLCFLILLPFVGIENVLSYSFPFWLSAIGIGFLGTAAAYFLWNEGIKLTGPNQAGIFINVVPLSTAVTSIILGDELLRYHLISGACILLGVLVLRMDEIKKYRFSKKS